MIQRILIYSGVVLLLLVMLVVMNLKFLIDGPLGSNLKFPALLETLEEQIEEEQWDQAKDPERNPEPMALAMPYKWVSACKHLRSPPLRNS